jgi:hypothetical protein
MRYATLHSEAVILSPADTVFVMCVSFHVINTSDMKLIHMQQSVSTPIITSPVTLHLIFQHTNFKML